MDRPAKEMFNRLGSTGLTRALDDLLDQSHLVRLANTCGIKYPGMRTQSQARDRLLADLVSKAGRHQEARTAIFRMLGKQTSQASRDWAGLSLEEKTRRLSDEEFLQANGNLGLHLYLLASQVNGAELDGLVGHFAHRFLVRVASNGAGGSRGSAKALREESRLRRKTQELEKKVRHLEGQLTKSRDAQKTFKRDLIQRKGELAESRMLAERLRRELTIAQSAAQAGAPSGSAPVASDKGLAALTKTFRQLASEQKKLAHRLDKRQTTAAVGSQTLAKLLSVTGELAKDLARDREQRQKELEAQAARIDELRTALRSTRSAPTAASSRTSKRSRAKGQAKRVGVFIDVQNMYYAARRLKGKIDFDALLQAAVQDRRLIQATAYVVESKETDQSQFIALLQQRAIQVQRKALKVRADGSMKGDWDMELALDILDAAPKLDVVVLVSGDGDFTSLVKRVKSIGPRVEVIAFPRNTAKALLEAADGFQPLDRKFMIYSKSKTRKPSAKPPAGGTVEPAREKAKSPSG